MNSMHGTHPEKLGCVLWYDKYPPYPDHHHTLNKEKLVKTYSDRMKDEWMNCNKMSY